MYMKLYYYRKDIIDRNNTRELLKDNSKYILMPNFDIYIHIDYILIFNEYIKFGRTINDVLKILKYNENKQ